MKRDTKLAAVTFGELLLRLDPFGMDRLTQAETFRARYTGAEANVAVSLAGFGVHAYAVSKVPAHEIGQACINYLRRFGVDTGFIVRGGERLGVLYVETGFSQRPAKVLYDRSHSSIRDLQPCELDWEQILAGKHWFHFSGTAPALGDNVTAVLEEALDTGKRLGVTTSCDCNYRSKLWEPADAGRVLSRLFSRVDVCIGGVEDAEKLFGVRVPRNVRRREGAAAEYAAQRLRELFGFAWVGMTLRGGASASVNDYSGLVCCAEGCFGSRPYQIQIVDRIGAGDAFTAGMVFQILSGAEPARVVEFAAAAACLKHTIPGDFNLVSADEVEELLRGGEAARVRR
ncbi:MAG TPA: sugar kinase [Candidatus Hydrogenedentes bacterium]|nr:sugar kinase [Candidatus Hydrogenedentota bacterium]HPV36694.1 sugar kinase [Candidatus Hydrogenedentota bacterium]